MADSDSSQSFWQRYLPKMISGQVLLLAALIGGFWLLTQIFDVPALLEQLLREFQQLGWLGHFGFIGCLAIVIVILFPNTPLQLGAGILFPYPVAVLYVLTAESLGAVLAMLVARHLFTEAWQDKMRQKKLFGRLNRILTNKGWRSVLATRLIPIFPFKTSNYAYGLTSVKAWQLWLGSFVGTAPRTAIVVYLGYLMGDLAEVQNQPATSPGLRTAIIVAGVLLGIGGGIYLWKTSQAEEATD